MRSENRKGEWWKRGRMGRTSFYSVKVSARWSAVCERVCEGERETKRERRMRAFGVWPCSISMSGSQTSHFSSHTSAFSDKRSHIPAALWRERARRVIVQKSEGLFTALMTTWIKSVSTTNAVYDASVFCRSLSKERFLCWAKMNYPFKKYWICCILNTTVVLWLSAKEGKNPLAFA